ncbi:AmmeMemoRadiSam system protein B [Rubricoccus marinus]|uniref:AmmeMemoRadiSam system protein B n=1 Tax=Rubricoccus marinus TaxID=716817 RepID=A0A259TVR8_9BACT|nr:AmmeMemoRadiSam system protein B [Rubricoccus marinus]OZC01833.1 AmmeMemoRadiSam system protein B [Rubricoccus marinus]
MSLAQRAVYPTQAGPLGQTLDSLLANAAPAPEADLIALVVPDSNRLAGGTAAAAAYAYAKGRSMESVILVSPSHTGDFGRLSICQADTYTTPLGPVAIDDRLRHELCDEDDDIFVDDTGHYHTEGADVQLPFLQRVLEGDFKAVPIVMGEESPAFCRELGHAVGEVLYGHRSLLVGSSDVVGAEDGALDALRDAIETFNTSELMHLLGSEKVKVEGMGSLIVTLLAAQARGANKATILALSEPDENGAPGAIAIALTRE